MFPYSLIVYCSKMQLVVKLILSCFILMTVHSSDARKRSHNNKRQASNEIKYPIILLPGYMGTQLKYSVDFSRADADMCNLAVSSMVSMFGEKTLWLNVANFLPVYSDCWLKFAKLRYDTNLKRSFPKVKGVNVRVPDFGSTTYMEYLAPFPQTISMTDYFHSLVNHLSEFGYQKGFNLRGAPYDWRKSPHEQQKFFTALKKLVETTYDQNGGSRVILMGHSMGGMFSYIFLKSQSLQWKKKYIRALFAIATPFGGTFKYLYDYLYANDYPANMFPICRQAERTFSAMAFLLPKPMVFKDSVLISTPAFNYTSQTYDRFFGKLKYPLGYQMFLDSNENYKDLKHPNVDIVVIGGLGFRTLRGLIYEKNDFRSTPKIVYGNGDEFVNEESLKACKVWRNTNGYSFRFKALREEHMSIIKSKRAAKVIIDSIMELN